VAKFEPEDNPPHIGTTVDVGVQTDQLHFFDIETGQALR